MRRADRLFQIVQYLRGGRLVTAAMLAERLEVSERTVYRDIADLQSTGVPIDGAAGVGYVLRSGYDLPPLMFTQDEIVALVAGIRMVRSWGGIGMARAAAEASRSASGRGRGSLESGPYGTGRRPARRRSRPSRHPRHQFGRGVRASGARPGRARS